MKGRPFRSLIGFVADRVAVVHARDHSGAGQLEPHPVGRIRDNHPFGVHDIRGDKRQIRPVGGKDLAIGRDPYRRGNTGRADFVARNGPSAAPRNRPQHARPKRNPPFQMRGALRLEAPRPQSNSFPRNNSTSSQLV